MVKKKLPQNIHSGKSGNQAGRHARTAGEHEGRYGNPVMQPHSIDRQPVFYPVHPRPADLPGQLHQPDMLWRILLSGSASFLTDSKYSRNAPQISW